VSHTPNIHRGPECNHLLLLAITSRSSQHSASSRTLKIGTFMRDHVPAEQPLSTPRFPQLLWTDPSESCHDDVESQRLGSKYASFHTWQELFRAYETVSDGLVDISEYISFTASTLWSANTHIRLHDLSSIFITTNQRYRLTEFL
jgi:hypothetical protein